MKHQKYITITTAALILFSSVVLQGATYDANGLGAPVPTGPYTNSTVGDWYLDDIQAYKNGTLIINGNLTSTAQRHSTWRI